MDTRSTRRDRAPVPRDEGDTVDHADIVNQVGERVDENRIDPSVAPEGSNSTEVDVIVERVVEKMQELWQTQQESCMLGVRHMVSEIMQHEWPSPHQEHQRLPAGGLNQPNKLKPGRYDGNTEWESYHRQFELIAEHNGWNNFSKAAALSSVLSGTALEILTERIPCLTRGTQLLEQQMLLKKVLNRDVSGNKLVHRIPIGDPNHDAGDVILLGTLLHIVLIHLSKLQPA
ncbi:hypothetical protein GE061_017868 [Apolygus lucorum]|uniref:Uncharacterized protein n=1 Tax=Apolygus lucorum TaxID=248454 RepID=A0A8S9XC75_APOLU|nr:hypothetical protein GE061_017868 [Apolygus lucorum]